MGFEIAIKGHFSHHYDFSLGDEGDEVVSA